MQDVDVVVIGAGAAGVGAGMALRDAGRDFVILEAQDRVGGRAFTDTNSLPYPWDQGCHWFHSADVNPLVPFADKLGVRYRPEEDFGDYGHWSRDRWLSADETAVQDDVVDAALDTVHAEGAKGRDVSAADVLPDTGTHSRYLRHLFHLMYSHEPEDVSAVCYSEYTETHTNWPVIGGYGMLVAGMAKGLPVRLDTPVRAIRDRPGGVIVVTDDGQIAAKAAIVTVSTNVLAAGVIDIALPEARPVLDRLAHVPCGFYEKIAVVLKRPLDLPDDALFFSSDAAGLPAVNWQRPLERPNLVIGHFGGTPARDIGAQGRAALTDFGLAHLTSVFGADILTQVAAVVPTGWQANSYVRGAYSAARPGHAADRCAAIEARTGRVAFAGEALSPGAQTTCHGAWASGQDVARRLLAEELRK